MSNETKTEHFLTEEQIEEIRTKAKREVQDKPHIWRQRGPYIICTSCDQQHAIHIGTKKMLVGIEGNMPKIIDL